MHSARSCTSQTPWVHSKTFAPGWVLIWVNFDPIGLKVRSGLSFEGWCYFTKLRYFHTSTCHTIILKNILYKTTQITMFKWKQVHVVAATRPQKPTKQDWNDTTILYTIPTSFHLYTPQSSVQWSCTIVWTTSFHTTISQHNSCFTLFCNAHPTTLQCIQTYLP